MTGIRQIIISDILKLLISKTKKFMSSIKKHNADHSHEEPKKTHHTELEAAFIKTHEVLDQLKNSLGLHDDNPISVLLSDNKKILDKIK